jgi:small-conductance mechanosensitive channel
MFKVFVLVSIAILFMGGPCALAQQTTPPPKSQGVTVPQYPIVLGNQTLYYIRDIQDSSGRHYSGQLRAKSISERIKGAAENPEIQPDAISTSAFDGPQSLILAGNELLASVVDQDVLEKGQTREQLATEYSRRISDAIEKYRQERSLKRLIKALVFTLIATLILIAILYLLNVLYRKVNTVIQNWVSSKKVSLHIQSFELVGAERMGTLFITTTKIIRLFVLLGAFYTYINFGLSFFPQTQAFAHHLFNYILLPLKTIGTAVAAQIPNLLFLAIIFLITVYVLKLMRLFFKGMEDGTITFKGFYPEWAQPTYRILRILIIAFAAVMAFPYIPGSDSSAFKGVSIFFGVLFSLGSTSAIANIVAGYTLTYRRVFKVGDRVKIADFVGDVIVTRLQVTHLRTIKNEEIVVPNSMIVSSHVINYSSLAQQKGLILHTTVTIGYDAPWRQVHALLLMAAEKTLGLLREPPPFVLQKSLDDFYITYELNAYTDTPLAMPQIYSDLHKNIQDAFNEYGVQIMSPSYRFDPDRPKVVPKDKWYAPPAKPPNDPETKD